MKEALFRATTLPQFSAEPSGVRLRRRESGNYDAVRTQGATRNCARADAESGRKCRGHTLSLLPQPERAAVVSQASAYQRALTPPGTLIKLTSKTLLKTGAWTVPRVLVHDHGSASEAVGSWLPPIQSARIIRSAVRPSGCRRTASAPPKTACGSLPPQPKSREIGRGMSLASSQRSPLKQRGALQESER
jgi:hypothetical protein